jgi:hypothetical protein
MPLMRLSDQAIDHVAMAMRTILRLHRSNMIGRPLIFASSS